MTKGKSNTIKSTHIRFGKRPNFFDTILEENNKKYLKITESKFIGEGKEKVHNTSILFPENISEFQKSMKEIVEQLV